jgi:hypothetical protein
MDSISEGREVLGPYILRDRYVWSNLDSTDGPNHNSATVPYLEYYYLKYSHDRTVNWVEQILVVQKNTLLKDPV